MKMLTIIAAALSFLAITSCNKCAECHYDKDSEEVEIGEYCGDDLEAIEASGFSDSGTTYEVHCHDH